MNPLDYTVLAAYAFSNIAAFILMGVDKWKALHRRSRIPESTLLLFSALLGALGGWLGMRVFRHKIREKKFVFSVPVMLLAQAAVLNAYLRHWR